MSAQLKGSLLKALGKIALDRDDSLVDAQSYVHLRPDATRPDTHSVVEVTNGRAIIWVEQAEPVDDGRCLSRDHAIDHIGKDDLVLLDGGEVRSPVRFSLPESRPIGSDFRGDTIEYPALDEHRPPAESRVRLSGVDPKRFAAIFAALGAICEGGVDILSPRAGCIGFRGQTASGHTVEAVLFEENLFGPRATDMPGERPAGEPGLFHDAVGRAVESLAPKPGSDISSVTLSSGGKSVTLTQEDGKRIGEMLGKRFREGGDRRAPKLAGDAFGDGLDDGPRAA